MRERRRAARGSGGFTLIELMVAMGILLLVITALLTQLNSAQRTQHFSADRAQVLDETRASMARMTIDLRQAWSIDPSSTAQHLVINTYVEGAQAVVTYDISSEELLRSVNGSTPARLQTHLADSSIFSYEPDVSTAQVVSVLLQVRPPASPDTVVQLTSEVRLRNLDGG